MKTLKLLFAVCLMASVYQASAQCNDYAIMANHDSVCPKTNLIINILKCDSVIVNAGSYATSIPSSAADGDITEVDINGGINNAGCPIIGSNIGSVLNKYSNFTDKLCLMKGSKGSTIPFTIKSENCTGGVNFNQGLAIFIDYNHDGILNTANEKVFASPTTMLTPATFVGSFVIPFTALSGNTLLRIVSPEGMSGANITPSGSYGWGETEDYAFNIQDSLSTGSDSTYYTWYGGSPTSLNAANSSITDSLSATTTYTIVANTGGCIDTLYKTIYLHSNNTVIFATSSSTPVTIPTPPNGSASVFPLGGISPYTYLWTPSGSTNANATGLSAGTYTWQVTDMQECVSSNSVVVSGISGIKNIDWINQFYITPNPAQNSIMIQASKTFDEVQITNALGAVVKSISSLNTKELVIDISSFSNGLYFIKTNNSANQKLIVNR